MIFIPMALMVGTNRVNMSDTASKDKILNRGFIGYLDEKEKPHRATYIEQNKDPGTPTQYYENNPTSGFVIIDSDGGTTDNKKNGYVLIQDPRGFVIPITIPNLIIILENSVCDHMRISGKFVYGFDNNTMQLISVHSNKYNEIVKANIAIHSNRYLTESDLKPGHIYQNRKGDRMVYMGYFPYHPLVYDFSKTSPEYHIYDPKNPRILQPESDKFGYYFFRMENYGNRMNPDFRIILDPIGLPFYETCSAQTPFRDDTLNVLSSIPQNLILDMGKLNSLDLGTLQQRLMRNPVYSTINFQKSKIEQMPFDEFEKLYIHTGRKFFRTLVKYKCHLRASKYTIEIDKDEDGSPVYRLVILNFNGFDRYTEHTIKDLKLLYDLLKPVRAVYTLENKKKLYIRTAV